MNSERFSQNAQTSLSIIVPSKNESEHIYKVLTALKNLTLPFPVDITVVDNGSTDDTLQIALSTGVNVLSHKEATISAVRNYGAKNSRGKHMAFIDADVLITDSWRSSIVSTLNSLNENPLQVIGARCHAATRSSFLDKYWFNRLLEYDAAYINSGNLITSRFLFENISGFDAILTTAEDYDFCHRAKNAGAKITNNPELVSLHLGYPTTVLGFINRERWHGSQDCKDLKSLKDSKIAWLAIANLFMACFILCLSLVLGSFIWIPVYFTFLLALGALLTILRFGLNNLGMLLFTAILFSLYICGRSISIVDRAIEFFKSFLKTTAITK